MNPLNNTISSSLRVPRSTRGKNSFRKYLHWISAISVALIFSFNISSATAAPLELLLTQGVDNAIPIAVVPFEGQSAEDASAVSSVIQSDLQFSGRFKPLPSANLPAQPHAAGNVQPDTWRKTGVESVVVGKVEQSGSSTKVHFALVDVFNAQRILAEQSFTVPTNQLRRLSHHISDIIYQKLTGVRGIFSTRIAYVTVQRNPGKPARYQLEIADADGHNPRPILTSNEPIMSPSWSHDGKRIAYVSFEGKRARIFISDIATGQRKMVSSYPRINSAPAWSPDNSKMALVLSKDGSPKIYILNLASGQLQQVTQGRYIDTEPAFSPDGQSLYFTSDRGGAPQIYRIHLASGQTDRITFKGAYNARANITQDGKRMVTLHRESGEYGIAVHDLSTGTMQVLTRSGRDDSPSIAPNGMMVLYGQENGRDLRVVSVDKRIHLSLPTRAGRVQNPAWSPFLD
ncbi:MAG: Tol-Pal system beta propeller repeat protein TolB [Gammaproteobacteria bacterium]